MRDRIGFLVSGECLGSRAILGLFGEDLGARSDMLAMGWRGARQRLTGLKLGTGFKLDLELLEPLNVCPQMFKMSIMLFVGEMDKKLRFVNLCQKV